MINILNVVGIACFVVGIMLMAGNIAGRRSVNHSRAQMYWAAPLIIFGIYSVIGKHQLSIVFLIGAIFLWIYILYQESRNKKPSKPQE
jgi:uncharacterized membrane protein HdeD (DUF308 family)